MSFNRLVRYGLLLCTWMISTHTVEASTTKEVFAKFPNRYFIETGSWHGDGIQMALDVGFAEVHSIELGYNLYQHCRFRFFNRPNVHLHHGDSGEILSMLLQSIDAPATFWLDGHYSEGDTAKGNSWTPVLRELDCIKQHWIKTHTILIDDIRECGKFTFDFITKDQIIAKLLEINPDYEISFEPGYIPNDVLVARVPADKQ